MSNDLDKPLDTDSTFKWTNPAVNGEGPPIVDVLEIYVDEDLNAQVAVMDGRERRTVTPEDIAERIEDGKLERLS